MTKTYRHGECKHPCGFGGRTHNGQSKIQNSVGSVCLGDAGTQLNLCIALELGSNSLGSNSVRRVALFAGYGRNPACRQRQPLGPPGGCKSIIFVAVFSHNPFAHPVVVAMTSSMTGLYKLSRHSLWEGSDSGCIC